MAEAAFKPGYDPQSVDAFKVYLQERSKLPKEHENHLSYQVLAGFYEGLNIFIEYALREELEVEDTPPDAVSLAFHKAGVTEGNIKNYTRVKAAFEFLDWMRKQGVDVTEQQKPKLTRVGAEKAAATRAVNTAVRKAARVEAREVAKAGSAPPALAAAISAAIGSPVTSAPQASAPRLAAPPPAPRAAAPSAPRTAPMHDQLATFAAPAAPVLPQYTEPVAPPPSVLQAPAEPAAEVPAPLYGVLPPPGAAPKHKAGVNPAAHAIPAGGFKIAVYRQVMGVPEPIFMTRTSAGNVASVGAIAEFLQKTIVIPRVSEFAHEDVVTFIVKAVDQHGREGEGTGVPVEVPRNLRDHANGRGGHGERWGARPVYLEDKPFNSLEDAANFFRITTDEAERRLRGIQTQVTQAGASGTGSVELQFAMRDLLTELRDGRRQVDERLGRIRDEFLSVEQQRGQASTQGALDLAALAHQQQPVAQPPSPMETAMANMMTAHTTRMLEGDGGPDPLEQLGATVEIVKSLMPAPHTGPSPELVEVRMQLAAVTARLEAMTKPQTNAAEDFFSTLERHEKFLEKLRGGRGDTMEMIMGLGMMLTPVLERGVEALAGRQLAARASQDNPNVPEEVAEAIVKCLTSQNTTEVLESYVVVLGHASEDPDVAPYLEKLAASMRKPGGKAYLVMGIQKILHKYGFTTSATPVRVERLVRIVSRNMEQAQLEAATAATAQAQPSAAPAPQSKQAAPAAAPAAPVAQSAPVASAPADAAADANALASADDGTAGADANGANAEGYAEDGGDTDENGTPSPEEVLAALDEMPPEHVAQVIRGLTEKMRGGVAQTAPGSNGAHSAGEALEPAAALTAA